MRLETTLSARTLGRMLGPGAFVGACVAGLPVFANMVLAFVSAFQAVPGATDFAVSELSVVALIAIALGAIAGGMSGLLVALTVRLFGDRSKSTNAVVAALIASVPPGVITAVCARLLVTHTSTPVNVSIGLVVGAIASGLFAVLSRTEQRLGGLDLHRWRRPLLVCGAIGLAMGALLGLSNGVFTQYDLSRMGQIYIFSAEFFDPMVPLVPTILGDAALGASIGLIAAWLAVSFAFFAERGTNKTVYPLTTFAATLFVIVGGAGLVGARLDGLFYPSLSSVLSKETGMIIAEGDKSAWPQAVLTGIEWGTCAAAIGIVLFVGLSQRRWFSRWRLFIAGIIGGATIAGLLGASIWAETWISASGVDTDEARAVLYPAAFGTSIAIGIGALAGLLAAMTANALIARVDRRATPRRAAFVAMSVVLLIGGVPLLHLAIYPDGESLLPHPLPLAFNSGIVLLMVGATGLLAGFWARSTPASDTTHPDATPAEISESQARSDPKKLLASEGM